MFNKLFSGRVPEQEEIDDLRAEIEEARRIHDYAQAKKLQKKLQKIERKASKGKPTARSVERKDSTRRIVPFDALSEGGIMRRDAGHYQCAIEVDDVNYIAARAAEQEDVRILWGDYLNSLDHNIEVHIYLDNHKVDDEVFLKSLKMSPVAGDSDGNVLRAEFDAYCRDKLNGSSRAMRRTRTVVITVAADTREKAAPVLTREAERLIRTMRDLESDARMLSGQDWLDRITTHTHPDDAEGVIDLRESARAVGIGSRDLAAPSSIVRIGERADDSRMLVAGRRWVQSYVMTLEGYGNSMRDTFITDLARLPYDISVSWHIKPWATDVAISAAERHLREITEENDNYKMSRSRPERGYFIDDENLPSSMRDARDEAQAYRDDLVRNDERNFSIVTVVTAEAKDEEELDEACKQIEAVFSVHRKPKPDSWGNLREQMYTASLPIGVCDLPYARTLTTEPLSHMIMWASAELMDDGGMIMGINPTTNAFETYDPTRYEHTNSFTFGQPGSGKSMTAKLTRIIQTHLRHPDDDVIIIDPENEYAAVTQKLGGQVIDIHEGSPDHINPLDISASYGAENPDTVSDPVPAKVSFLQALVHMMASSITDTQKNLLDQAGKYVYAAWQQDQRPENIPTLRDVYDYLNAIEGEVAPDAHHLATLIKRYVVGTLNAFAHPTNVDIDNHLVDLVFSKISRELRPIAMLVHPRPHLGASHREPRDRQAHMADHRRVPAPPRRRVRRRPDRPLLHARPQVEPLQPRHHAEPVAHAGQQDDALHAAELPLHHDHEPDHGGREGGGGDVRPLRHPGATHPLIRPRPGTLRPQERRRSVRPDHRPQGLPRALLPRHDPPVRREEGAVGAQGRPLPRGDDGDSHRTLGARGALLD